jgi:hypothetical protein
MNGTAISPTINENGIVPTQDETGVYSSDGYSIAGIELAKFLFLHSAL